MLLDRHFHGELLVRAFNGAMTVDVNNNSAPVMKPWRLDLLPTSRPGKDRAVQMCLWMMVPGMMQHAEQEAVVVGLDADDTLVQGMHHLMHLDTARELVDQLCNQGCVATGSLLRHGGCWSAGASCAT